jgi:hypothetical protein
VTRRELLDIRERQWAPLLRNISLVAEAEIRETHRTQVASALGVLYGQGGYAAGQSAVSKGVAFLARWPACLVASMTGVAVTSYAQGTYWPALWKAAGYRGDADDQHVWGTAFVAALPELGLPMFSESYLRFLGPILMHAGIPAYCLGDFFRLLAERRRQEPGLDADSFIAWATAPGRKLRLSELDKPAERFLLNGGDYAHDVVDRTLDLLDRLTDPDPDLDAVRLPSYMIEAAKSELASGHLDLSRSAARRTGDHRATVTRREAQPRIGLDPYGQGVHVLLPAVGDTADGVARWRVTADGDAHTVQSRAIWVGAAETTPQTVFPLNRPVRTVLVALAGREDLTAELSVVDQHDPLLFFGEDGRRLASTVSLPRSQLWIMHPADRELEFNGEPGQVVEPTVPFGWDGWRLCSVSLENVQAVGLRNGRAHQVEVQARPRLLLGEPLPGAMTPFGSPVYPALPQLLLPRIPGADITWYAEIRRVGGGAPLVSRQVHPAETNTDIWSGVPRPVLGAFEVTVRGPLGRGLRRTIFIAEGLSITYEPQVRLLTAVGLAKGRASLTTAIGATVNPSSVHFGPNERAKPLEYRTADESEPIVITPPHAAVLCPGAGVTAWTTSILRLVAEDFAAAGRLLVRVLANSQHGDNVELAVHVRGQQVQAIPPSGQQTAGLAAFELARAVDTIATSGRAELTVSIDGRLMPVGTVRPRRLASGVELAGDKIVLRESAAIEGLMAGVYLTYAPWRPPTELPIAADGTATLGSELRDAGPLRVLLRIDDPWAVSNWPTWPISEAFACPASGFPKSPDPEEEALSRFVAGQGELPELVGHLGWLWRVLELAPELVKAGARLDLDGRCTSELRRRPRAAVLSILDAELSTADAIHALITAGLAGAPAERDLWTIDERYALVRMWAALPAAAAIASGDLLNDDNAADAAISQCGDSFTEILKGHTDPNATVGGFVAGTERIALLPPEQIEAMWQAAAVVPRAMLDADTRATAALRMFEARNMSSMRSAALTARVVTNAAELLLRRSRHVDLACAITARKPSIGSQSWLGLPAMSIAMALLARLAARGDGNAAMLEREYRSKWANLALHAPDLVAIDLVLAEALVTAALADQTALTGKTDMPEEPE